MNKFYYSQVVDNPYCKMGCESMIALIRWKTIYKTQ